MMTGTFPSGGLGLVLIVLLVLVVAGRLSEPGSGLEDRRTPFE